MRKLVSIGGSVVGSRAFINTTHEGEGQDSGYQVVLGTHLDADDPKSLDVLDRAVADLIKLHAELSTRQFNARPAVSRDHCDRCDRCGWPLATSVDDGCVRGNCSMRPLPSPRKSCGGCGARLQPIEIADDIREANKETAPIDGDNHQHATR